MKAILFFDDWLVERRTCLERVWGKPRFVKELFDDYPKGYLGYAGYSTAFYDERLGRYVLYNSVYPPEADPGTFVVRLQSDDPYNWPNPVYDLSVTPGWKGFQDVCLTADGQRFWPWVRSLAGTPHAARGYLATAFDHAWKRKNTFFAYSDDGLHFDVDWQHPWHTEYSDTWSGVVWNQRAGLYEIYTRPVCVDRRVALLTTPDLEHFGPITTVLQPDHQDRPGTEFYSMPNKPYEDLFVGLVHVMTPDTIEEARAKFGGRMETELTYSYNGLNWYRTVRQPFVGVRDYGEQGGGAVYAMEMLRTNDHKLLFIVEAGRGEHKAYPDMQKAGMDTTGFFAPLLYEMRLDGFCSLKTWGRDGILRTKTIIPQAGDLRLNVRTTKHTAVRVQILDGKTAEPIPGYTWEEAAPITGDHLFAPAAWKERANIAELIGRPVRIEIAMREAEIFGIRLDCQVFVGSTPTETV